MTKRSSNLEKDLLPNQMESTLQRTCSFHARWLKDTKFLQQLTDDNIDIGLIEKELSPTEKRRKQNQMKQMVLNVLNCYPVQIIIAILVLIDAGIIIAEIVLEIHAMKSIIELYSGQLKETLETLNEIERQYDKKGNTIQKTISSTNHNEKLSETDSHDKDSHELFDLIKKFSYIQNDPKLCSDENNLEKYATDAKDETRSTTPSYQKYTHDTTLSHQTKKKPKRAAQKNVFSNLHQASDKLHYTSIGILSFFVVELSIRIFCVGPSFFKARFELIDAIVILTSFIADVVILIIRSQEISIMIIFLLWRIVRVINGLLMHEKKKDEFRIYLQKKARRISEIKLDELSIEQEMQEKHYTALEELCYGRNIPREVINRCRPKFSQLHKCHSNPLKSIAALTTGFMGTIVGGHAPGKIMQKLATVSSTNQPETASSSSLHNGDASTKANMNNSNLPTLCTSTTPDWCETSLDTPTTPNAQYLAPPLLTPPILTNYHYTYSNFQTEPHSDNDFTNQSIGKSSFRNPNNSNRNSFNRSKFTIEKFLQNDEKHISSPLIEMNDLCDNMSLEEELMCDETF